MAFQLAPTEGGIPAEEQTIKLTGSAVKALGRLLTRAMARSNQLDTQGGCLYDFMDGRIDGILSTLDILGIPYKVRWQGAFDKYTAVEIAGETFYVDSGTKKG